MSLFIIIKEKYVKFLLMDIINGGWNIFFLVVNVDDLVYSSFMYKINGGWIVKYFFVGRKYDLLKI